MITETFSPKETFSIGRKMGETLSPGTIIALTGDLGCGKTVFTQGIAAGLAISEPVTSPTFTILQVYESGRLPLYHFDVYRIGEIEEMEELGYEEYFFGDGVCLVEWAGLIEELIPRDALWVTIRKDPARGDDYREISISS